MLKIKSLTKYVLGLAVLGGVFFSQGAKAAELPAEGSQPESVATLENLPDDQVVMALPEGAYIASRDGSSDFSSAEVRRNNGTLVTVKELRDEVSKENSTGGSELFNRGGVSLREATPYTQTLRVLAAGKYYRSLQFSGRGWRFSGMKFLPAAGTGDYLAWTSIGDDGRVGSYAQAASTYVGNVQGRALYASEGRVYIRSDRGGMFYYTYNPLAGTQYLVENW